MQPADKSNLLRSEAELQLEKVWLLLLRASLPCRATDSLYLSLTRCHPLTGSQGQGGADKGRRLAHRDRREGVGDPGPRERRVDCGEHDRDQEARPGGGCAASCDCVHRAERDRQTGKTLQLFKGHTAPVTSLAFVDRTPGSGKEDLLITGSWDQVGAFC